MEKNKNHLIAISYYDERPRYKLIKLLNKLITLTNNIKVIVNSDSYFPDNSTFNNGIEFIFRANIGMNIGAWNTVYKLFPDYEYYFFIQDECTLIRDDFIEKYIDLFSDQNVGLIGESLNHKWCKNWAELANDTSKINYEILINGYRIRRVNFYLNKLREWGINPGNTGLHVRSLVMAFPNDTLRLISPFPEGKNYEECVSSEIAISKLVEQNGKIFIQSSPLPFQFFSHYEWNRDGYKKI